MCRAYRACRVRGLKAWGFKVHGSAESCTEQTKVALEVNVA